MCAPPPQIIHEEEGIVGTQDLAELARQRAAALAARRAHHDGDDEDDPGGGACKGWQQEAPCGSR
jgi:hypothetical protein